MTGSLDWAASTGVTRQTRYKMSCCARSRASLRDALPASPVEWLTDNGSVYQAYETPRVRTRKSGLEPRTTAVRSPQSNGIAESFV